MANIIDIPTFTDNRGSLSVLENVIPFEIKRVYYIYNASNNERGGHRHKISTQALICVNGSCIISNNNGKTKEDFELNSASKCLILSPSDWHTMHSFTNDAVLLVLASTKYDINDYIDEPYND